VADEDDDDRDLEEGEVVVGFAVVAGGDAAHRFQPGVGAFDRPAVACLRVGGACSSSASAPDGAGRCAGRDRLAGAAGLADPWFDAAFAERLFELARGVAAVGPQFVGLDLARGERVEEREQMLPLVFVAGGEPDFEWRPGGVDG
jgi:hypothetical protein